jgi:hypothetical protein
MLATPSLPCAHSFIARFIGGMLDCKAFVTSPDGRSMTDQTVGLPTGTPRLRGCARMQRAAATHRALVRERLGRRGSMLPGLMRHFWLDEGQLPQYSFHGPRVTLGADRARGLADVAVLVATLCWRRDFGARGWSCSTSARVIEHGPARYDLFFYLSSWRRELPVERPSPLLLGLAAATAGVQLRGWLQPTSPTRRAASADWAR